METKFNQNLRNQNLRNLAIIAHVDHGKTTLVDALLKQGKVFREHQDVGELIMDSDPLERERGITILAKNTAVEYRGVKVNIIDTPGHADFSGEVERVMNMADGCLLLVDSVDGPMPQTRYVLQQALQRNVTPMVVINKIDRPEARIAEVEEMVQDLFLELATQPEQLDFPVLYASAKQGFASTDPGATAGDMQPLFDAILDVIPPPDGDVTAPLQMLVAALDYDNYLGQIAIGQAVPGRNPLPRAGGGNRAGGCPPGGNPGERLRVPGPGTAAGPGGHGRGHRGRVRHCQRIHRRDHCRRGLPRGPALHRD